MLRRLTPCILVVALGIVACDRSPGDPLDPRYDLASLLTADPTGSQPAPHTLPGLLHAAVHRVYTVHGPAAARTVVADLQRLQDDARRAVAVGDREAATARLEAVHTEELDVVLSVFGTGIVRRVMDGIELDAARLARSVADARLAGRDEPRADGLLDEAGALLAVAREAEAGGRHAAALDAATGAAARVSGVHALLADARRIATLAELHELAVAHRSAGAGDGPAPVAAQTERAAGGVAPYLTRTGDREAAQAAALAARSAQVALVLDVFGADAARGLVEAADTGIAEAGEALVVASAAGRDVLRLQRMIAVARDMNLQARTALESGDAPAALDLASHAAGLVNAARLALTIY
ncbi:MAG TPA: hypothetical protein VK929_09640 [Longimicrobiales bacterium]|nr:hypothetical protein [Longimicrobiales bacterium]